MELVTLNKDQRPIAAVRADDDLVREVDAYVARLRTRAAELRAEADRCDALAAVSEPVPVVLVAAAVEDDPAVIAAFKGLFPGAKTYEIGETAGSSGVLREPEKGASE